MQLSVFVRDEYPLGMHCATATVVNVQQDISFYLGLIPPKAMRRRKFCPFCSAQPEAANS